MIARRLKQKRHGPFEQGPRRFAGELPAASVVGFSLLALLPVISMNGWWPDFGLLALMAWRLQRSDPFPNWAAIPLGLVNDLLTLHPIGLSITTFTVALLVFDLMDARKMRGNLFTDWLVAIMLIAFAEFLQLWIAAIQDAAMPIRAMLAPVVISGLFFPIMAGIVALLDRYRLRK